MVENMVFPPSKCLWSTMVDGIFSILAADSLTFLQGLPRNPQKGKRWSQYELGVAFSRNLYGNFVLDTNIWAILSFLIDFTCFLSTTRSPVSNYLMSLTLLRSSLCLSLFSDNRMLNNSICINMSGDEASQLSKAYSTSEVPSCDLSGDRSIGNWILIHFNSCFQHHR